MSVWVQLFAKAVVSNFIVNQQVLCNVLQLRERLKIKIDYVGIVFIYPATQKLPVFQREFKKAQYLK